MGGEHFRLSPICKVNGPGGPPHPGTPAPLLSPSPAVVFGVLLSWSVIWAPVKLKPPGEMLGYHLGLCLRRGAVVWEAGRQADSPICSVG